MSLRSNCRSFLRIFPTIGLCAPASLVLTVGVAGAASHHRILYSFCQSNGCPDGITPFNGLATDGSGSYFGTTTFGGNSSYHGTIYSIVMTSATRRNSTNTVPAATFPNVCVKARVPLRLLLY